MPIALVVCEFIDNLLLIWKPTSVVFGEYVEAVCSDVKYAAAAFDQLSIGTERIFKPVCQTGSS